MMELKQASDRIWYSMYEEERDRPCLGYIRGDRFSIAVDAGHSAAHVEEFYAALQAERLPLPALTVLTHWHWDHTFGLHAVNGLSIANERTNLHLKEFKEKVDREGTRSFLSLDPSIRREYAKDCPVVIVPADMVFDKSMVIAPGGLTVCLSTCVSPHTDDTTLVFIPEEKCLFLGDCISGVFPTWERDPAETRQLIDTLRSIDAAYCIGGHWPVFDKHELIASLEEETLP